MNVHLWDASPDQEDVREGLNRELTRRWTATAREVRRAILLHDALGVGDKAPRLAMPTADKAEMFRRWLNERLSVGVGGYDGSWVGPFVRRASARGALAGLQDAAQAQLGFLTPGAAPSARACHGATVASLAGICADVSAQAHGSVAQGLLSQARPSQIARLVDHAMGRGLQRSRALAEHSVTQAYTQAALDALDAAGVTHVGTVSERRRRLRDFDPDEPRDPHGRWVTQTSSPEFKAWFGKSKVVDEAGQPKVVYHGSTSGFDEFATGKSVELGAHFGTHGQAAGFGSISSTNSEYLAGAQVYPVYLRIEKPLRLKDTGAFDAYVVGGLLADEGMISDRESERISELWTRDQLGATERVRRIIEKKGYDGVVYLNRREGTGHPEGIEDEDKMSDEEFRKAAPQAEDSYIAFKPEQIKSALGNKGTFDPRAPRIIDFDPDEPRDESGRWTEGGSISPSLTQATGEEFVSPSTETGLTFDAARQALAGKRQAAMLKVSDEIDGALGLKETARSVIGAWSDGAENSVMATLPSASWDEVRLSAAMKGYVGDQKVVLAFRQDDKGDALLYAMHVKGSLDDIHHRLLADGLQFHTLAPTSDGADVYVADLDGGAHDGVQRAAEDFHAHATYQRGRAEFIGTSQEAGSDREQRDDARRAYEGVIRQSPVQRGAEVWRGNRDRWSAALAQAVADALFDLFADAARKTPQPKHPRSGQFAKAHIVARESRRSKRTGQFRRQGLSPEEQRKEELREARFGRVKGRLDVLTAGDDRVCDVCDGISANGPYTINEARSLIPAHPNCRCVFVAAGSMKDALVDFDPDEPRDEAGRWSASDRFLRTAIRYGDKIFVGHQGQHHFDLRQRILKEGKIKASEDDPYAKEDASGFVDHRGRFRPILAAATVEYAENNGLLNKVGEQLAARSGGVISDYLQPRRFNDALLDFDPDEPRDPEGKWTDEGIVAYHGSAADFTRFDISHIGEGEGSLHRGAYGNEFGHGLYFAEEKKVAEAYQEEMVPRKSWDDPIGGNLYQVRIHAKPEEFLDWDKPIGRQPAGQKILAAQRLNLIPANLTGGQLIHTLYGSGKAGSAKLAALGIKGVRYLDELSRATGAGTSNYVVFDPGIVEITHKNGVKLTKAEARDAMIDMLIDAGFNPDEPRDHGKWTSGGEFQRSDIRDLTKLPLMEGDAPYRKGEREVVEVARELVGRAQQKLRAMGIAGGRITVENTTKARDGMIARAIADETEAALETAGNAGDWYTHKIDSALRVAALEHPEVLHDRNARSALSVALAVTSQGEAVPRNVVLADEAYSHRDAKGHLPETLPASAQGPDMLENFKKYNQLVDKLGLDGATEFLGRKMTVKKLTDPVAKGGFGYKFTALPKDAEVSGSAIFGAKIGDGFYQNLMGNFEPVTQDQWFIRTWGRLTGTLMDATKTEQGRADQYSRFTDALKKAGMRVPGNNLGINNLARSIYKQHESDYGKYRAEYQSGQRKKGELVLAAQALTHGLDGIKQHPGSGRERRWRASVVNRAREMLEHDGRWMTNADLQATIWYPEKTLYERLGSKGPVGGLADYSSGFAELMRQKDHSEDEIAAALRAPH